MLVQYTKIDVANISNSDKRQIKILISTKIDSFTYLDVHSLKADEFFGEQLESKKINYAK
jgi:hypothetical protein